MNRFFLADLTAQPQFADPVIEQLDQTNLTYTQEQFDSLSGSLLFLACLCVVAGFFCIGVAVGKQHNTRHHKLIAIRLRQIQTLERIWQMTAKRRD